MRAVSVDLYSLRQTRGGRVGAWEVIGWFVGATIKPMSSCGFKPRLTASQDSSGKELGQRGVSTLLTGQILVESG